MAARIGEVLIGERSASAAAVREALQNQVIFGGRVGTNLLELGGVSEEALAAALGRRHGCGHLAGPAALDPAVIRTVPAELADRWEMVPLALDDHALTIAAADPSNLAMLDEVAFVVGRRVVARVAAEARIWAFLRSAYGLVRQLRGIELEPDGLPAASSSGPAARGPEPAAGDLMDEAAFDAIYGPARSGPGIVPAAGPPRGAPAPPEDVIELTDDMLERPVAAPPTRVAPAPLPAPEPEPLGFVEAVAALGHAAERTAIARIVLRYARARLRRAVLFTVNRGIAQGWVGLGEGLAARAPAIRLPLSGPGVLETVVRTRAHFLGPLPRTEANIRLLKALGGGVPANALLVPILALGRVVNVLYADAGRGATVDAGGVGELLILATRIAQSYESLVARV